MIISDSEFWQQSLELYANKANQQKLLEQQEQIGLNVNLALLCQCFDDKNLEFSGQLISDLHEAVSAFSLTYTTELRALRKRVKQDLSDSMSTESLRDQLLKAELEFEKLEQKLLVQELSKKAKSLTPCAEPKNYIRYLLHCQNLI